MNMKSLAKSVLITLSFLFLTKTVPTTSIYGLFILAIVYFADRSVDTDKNIFAKIGSVVFSLFAVLNVFQVNVYDDILGSYSFFGSFFVVLIIFVGTYLAAELVLGFLFRKFDRLHANQEDKTTVNPNAVFVLSFVLLILFYLPVWMMEYPSNVSPDTLDQIGQILSGKFVNHHPYAHTMWLSLLMSLGNDINSRVGFAALAQLVTNALVFSFVARTIYVKTKKFYCFLLTLLFYLLLSYHAFYSITLIKDVTHATIACILLMVIIFYFDENDGKRKRLRLILIGLFSILFCLFRTNGYYAFILLIMASAFFGYKRKNPRLVTILIVSFLFSTLIKGPVYDVLNVSKASFAESISVPAQQIALVIKNNGEISKDEKAALNKIVDISSVGQAYDVFLSDPVKNLINEGNISYLEKNKAEYLKVWIGIGLKNPFEYLQAWVNQFSGYFSPHYYSTSIFWGVWDNRFGIEPSPILITGHLNEVLHGLASDQHDLPFIGWLHYPSVTTWILLICITYSLRSKDYESFVLMSPLLGIFLTLMISCPFNLCFRYYYAVICCLPLFVSRALFNGPRGADQ